MSARKSATMPEFSPDLPHPVTRQVRRSVRLEGTAGGIMLAARELCETEGVASTSMAAIARKADVARGLVYYYSPDKQAVTDAVLDDYLEDMLESVSTWNELRIFGDTLTELKNCVATFRRVLYTTSGQPRPMFAVLDELGMREQFATQAVREAATCIQDYIVSEYTAVRISRDSPDSRDIRTAAVRPGGHDEGEARYHRRSACRTDRADASSGYDGARSAAVVRAPRRTRPAGAN